MKLSPLLDKVPFSHLNEYFACGVLGRACSDKSSLITGLIQPKNDVKKNFHKIYFFRNSIQSDGNELTLETLTDVYNKIKENAREELSSLIIFDEVQDKFKGECKQLLLTMFNNRRYLKTCLIVVAQSYTTICLDLRRALTSHFLFDLSNAEYDIIYKERVCLPKHFWDSIITEYRKSNGNFLFLDSELSKVFINWDEVIFEE